MVGSITQTKFSTLNSCNSKLYFHISYIYIYIYIYYYYYYYYFFFYLNSFPICLANKFGFGFLNFNPKWWSPHICLGQNGLPLLANILSPIESWDNPLGTEEAKPANSQLKVSPPPTTTGNLQIHQSKPSKTRLTTVVFHPPPHKSQKNQTHPP